VFEVFTKLLVAK